MIREIDLVSYLPPFIAGFKEISATLEAENPEFLLVWRAADQVLKNEFIETSDEYGISRFEKMLNILPSWEDTLESRRAKVRSQWINVLPYTVRMLLQKLQIICGSTDFVLKTDFEKSYTLILNSSAVWRKWKTLSAQWCHVISELSAGTASGLMQEDTPILQV